MKLDENGVPRRNKLDLITPVEKMIYGCVLEIDNGMPADERLTKAIQLLNQARELVADFIDNS